MDDLKHGAAFELPGFAASMMPFQKDLRKVITSME
jgi:hypothetical protein